MLRPGLSPGGKGVVVRRAAVFPSASPVGVACSPCVGVPSFPRVVSGGWLDRAGVISTASDSCFGGVCWGCASPGVVRRLLGVGRCWSLRRGMVLLGVGRGACRGALCLCASVPAPAPSWSLGGFLPPRCVSSGALSLWAPAPHFGPLRAPLPECPLLSLALPLPVPFPFPVWWWWGGEGGADGPGLGVGGLEQLAEEEGPLGRLRHDGLRGGWGAGAHLLEEVHHVHPFSPSRFHGPLHPAAELLQSGGTPPGEVGGGPGGEGSELEVLERRGEDVDLRWWREWRCLGERAQRWRGLGVNVGYGRRGEREGEVDVGWRWRTWRRLGEGVWWWRGLGVVDGYGRRGERGAGWDLWGEGEVDVGRRWRERRWWGLGKGVAYGQRGEREVRWGPWGDGGGGHGAAVAWVVVPGRAGAAGAGSRGVVVAPWGARAARVGG